MKKELMPCMHYSKIEIAGAIINRGYFIALEEIGAKSKVGTQSAYKNGVTEIFNQLNGKVSKRKIKILVRSYRLKNGCFIWVPFESHLILVAILRSVNPLVNDRLEEEYKKVIESRKLTNNASRLDVLLWKTMNELENAKIKINSGRFSKMLSKIKELE